VTDASSTARAREALASAKPAVFWTDGPVEAAVAAEAADMAEGLRTDLAIVGGGFTGLWAAIVAAEREPGRSIVVLEAGQVGSGASGRNGGFVADSLTHGLAHGARMWPHELAELLRLGRRNLDEIEAFVGVEGIEAGLRRCGKTTVAVAEHHVAELAASAERLTEHGEVAELLGAASMQADVASPTFRAGLHIRSGYALVDPARLVRGLAEVARRRGVRIVEGARVRRVAVDGSGLRIHLEHAEVRAARAVMATNAFPAPLRRVRPFLVPFYDYALVTEPLSGAQWQAVGWRERQGITDAGNFFHYYRPTDDGRILWGGYDAVYHFGGRVDASLEQDETAQLRLAKHFFETFPQLEGLRFSHRWGGAIDSTSRFTPFFGRALRGRLAYALGYTGLGVASSRFGAAVALDLVDGRETELTALSMVRRKPIPFPPEPFRWLAVRLTQAELARQDRNDGRPTAWLRLLDRFGVGFTT
jgi:glycine/D-amino acid oxidase-like deaminating enzyme